MSKEEMKSLDDQVLSVANRAGETRRSEDAKHAERCAEQEERNRLIRMEEEARKEKQRIMAAQKRKALLVMMIRVFACVVAVSAFVALLLLPEAVPVIGCAGILIFACTCAVVIDRYVRSVRRCR